MKPFHKKIYTKRVALDINARVKERVARDIKRQKEKKDIEDLIHREELRERIKELSKNFTFRIP
jgi:hypothetical protein